MTTRPRLTVGDLTPNAIGRDRIIVQYEGSTVSGMLHNLDIEADVITDGTWDEPHRTIVADVRVAITLGSITVSRLRREHPCEVVS